jgi:site-specific DNA recombinase
MNCSIYTRVSTDNQVEKDYNSLETQKESLMAYIQAHKYEGWVLVDVYEEAGFSAATLDRPELQRLLNDIRKKRVDAVLVYKIDRLTRNQKDFYFLIDLFEKYNVTFIATTQNFDTSSAAGRLMRNIMLDFAQFEREMTAERTRDKMEARAKKGLWNGGLVPLGYDYLPEEKKLKANPEEAKIVRLIFEAYLKEKSLAKVIQKINFVGYRTKPHPTKCGRSIGGGEFIITSVSHILTNPIYIGLVKHRENTYQGQHPPIIEKEVFDKVREILGMNKKTFTSPSQNKYNFLLQGLVRCGECGSLMSSHYSIKDGQKYFYYKCTRIMHRDREACPSKPLSAREFENAVIDKIKELSQDRDQLEATLQNANLVAQEELKPLREREALLEEAKREKEEEIQRLVKAIKTGSLEIESIERELRQLEKEKKALEGEIEGLNIYIRREESKLIDIDTVQRTYQGFRQFFPSLQPKEQHQFLQLLIKEMAIYPVRKKPSSELSNGVYKDRVKVSLYEVPEIALSIQNSHTRLSDGQGLCEPSIWLPFIDTYRTLCITPTPDIKEVFNGLRQFELAA